MLIFICCVFNFVSRHVKQLIVDRISLLSLRNCFSFQFRAILCVIRLFLSIAIYQYIFFLFLFWVYVLLIVFVLYLLLFFSNFRINRNNWLIAYLPYPFFNCSIFNFLTISIHLWFVRYISIFIDFTMKQLKIKDQFIVLFVRLVRYLFTSAHLFWFSTQN